MPDFYTEMAGVAAELLAPTSQGGLGQGSLVLMRQVPGAPPANGWEPPSASTWVATPLKGAVRGVGKDLVGKDVAPGVQLVATDLQAIVAPWGGTADPTDILEIDGVGMTILAIQRIPEAGITSAVRLFLRA